MLPEERAWADYASGLLYAGICQSEDEQEREKEKKDLKTPPEEAAQDEAAPNPTQDNKQPTGTQQPVQKPSATLVSATNANEPVVVEEKFKNEMLLKQLYEATTNSCGKYVMPHFAAHMDELKFTSVENNGKPSYHKTKELEAFEKAGGSNKASPSAAAVTVEITLFSCRWMRSLQVFSPVVTSAMLMASLSRSHS